MASPVAMRWGDALGLGLVRLKASLAEGCWQDGIQAGAAISVLNSSVPELCGKG